MPALCIPVPEDQKKAKEIVGELKSYGYNAFHQEDGWIIIDKTTDASGVGSEIDIMFEINPGRTRI